MTKIKICLIIFIIFLFSTCILSPTTDYCDEDIISYVY